MKAREGDIGFALAPQSIPGFLDLTLSRATNSNPPATQKNQSPYTPMERVSAVTVVAIDRDNLVLVVDLNSYWASVIAAMERSGVMRFDQDIMLDPIHQDFMVKRLKATLNAIGNPPVAYALPGLAQAVGSSRQPTAGSPSPAADVLWDGKNLAVAASGRAPQAIRQKFVQSGLGLNPSQWQAWSDALSRRLQLVWGPPGTGKSRTLRAVVLGAIHDAVQRGVPIRALVSGPTYEAIDNVLLELGTDLTQGGLALTGVSIARLRSPFRPASSRVPATYDVPNGSPQYLSASATPSASERPDASWKHCTTGLPLAGRCRKSDHASLRLDSRR